MPRFHISVIERTITNRETWVEADTEDEAREAVEEQDWRDFDVTSSSTDTEIDYIEEDQSPTVFYFDPTQVDTPDDPMDGCEAGWYRQGDVLQGPFETKEDAESA
jgi:flagellar basal body rod protein FlgC